MLHDFTNLRKYVGGVLNTFGVFKNIPGACQLSKSAGIIVCFINNNKKIMEN